MRNVPMQTLWLSTLENGYTLTLKLEVGSFVTTQWGERRVVSCQLITVPLYVDDMPEGC